MEKEQDAKAELKRTIKNIRMQTDRLIREIDLYKIEIDEIERKKNKIERSDGDFNFFNFNGILFNGDLIDKINNENKKKAKLSHEEKKYVVTHEITNINQAPLLENTFETNISLSPLLLSAVLNHKIILREKEAMLSQQYKKIKRVWEKRNNNSGSSDIKDDENEFEWPDEMPSDKTVNMKKHSKPTVKDKPLNLDYYLDGSYGVRQNSGFVEDPIKEYNEYSARNPWTPEEERIFFIRFYTENSDENAPKKNFDYVAEGLPTKSYEDIIEYYYINRDKFKDNSEDK